jgi:hypothetical protein
MKRTFRNILYSAYESALTRLNRFFSTLRSRLSLGWQGAIVGPGLRTSGPCHFKLRKAGSIRFGRNVTWEACFRRVRVGMTNPVILETSGGWENRGASRVRLWRGLARSGQGGDLTTESTKRGRLYTEITKGTARSAPW